MSSRKRYCKSQNNQSPDQGEIRRHNKAEKNNFKKQLLKYLKDPNYEIIQQGYRHSALWDWN